MHLLNAYAAGNKRKPDLNTRKEDDSSKTGDPDEEESKEHEDFSDVEGDDGDEASEEDEADGQSGDMEEDKGEGNQSVGVVESGKSLSLYIHYYQWLMHQWFFQSLAHRQVMHQTLPMHQSQQRMHHLGQLLGSLCQCPFIHRWRQWHLQ